MDCHFIFHKLPLFIIIGCLLMTFPGRVEARPRAEVSSARTRLPVRSASGEEIPWATSRSRDVGIGKSWRKCHRKFAKEVEVADSMQGYDVIFYGDSIKEAWRGTFMGTSWTPYKEVPKLWNKYFAKKYKAAAFGISGDKTGNLMWRLIKRELPVKKSPKVIVLMIGTNDVEGQRCTLDNALETVDRLRLLVNHVHSVHPRTHIVVLGLLPKGEDWPNMCSDALRTANGGFQGLAANSTQVHFMDLTSEFVRVDEFGKWEINETLLPDTLHPSYMGMDRIADKIEHLIDSLLSGGSPAPAPASTNPV